MKIKISRKYWRLLLTTLVVLNISSFLFLYLLNDYRNKYQFFLENYLSKLPSSSSSKTANSYDQSCHLPIDQFGPFDQSIIKYLELRPKQIECDQQQYFQPITYVKSGWLRQNNTEYDCNYQFIWKNLTDDSYPLYSDRKKLDIHNGLQLLLKENYIYIECHHQLNGNYYENLHYWFNPQINNNNNNNDDDDNLTIKNVHINEKNTVHYSNLDENPKSSSSSTTTKTTMTDEISVFILVIESLSRLNYQRYLNQTRNILENDYGYLYYLNGLNKIADNSFPNMVPLLTGKRAYNNELWNDNYGPYDDWPLIWKQFQQKGYRTALVEDYPKFSLFNYESKGFTKHQPTDFYPRPFWLRLFEEYNTFRTRMEPFDIDHCYKNRVPKIDIFLDQTKHFIERCQQQSLPYFGFFFYIEITHNDFNAAQMIDSHLAKFFKQTKHSLDNNTIVILMGDHGNRFGSVLETQIGRIEERMPLFAIRLPEQLHSKHQNLSKYLDMNRSRLATWLDVNVMLNDILNANYTSIDSNNNNDDDDDKLSTIRSRYSPWRETIPLNRNCSTALIPDLYCACDSHIMMETNSSLITDASYALVDYLNEILIDYRSVCHRLVLNQTRLAEQILPSTATVHYRNYRQQIELTILVEPSKGLFRSRLYRTANDPDHWIVESGQITRINKYGQQSSCITQRDLKPFCYCYDQQQV
ncbi:hypothetical protein HUG17_0041 [Dermatophagoides farinae]|uniref:Uncharacterized protein n=1 Tax=Dermatophagoides farinae TaxID=6954 RepID=A0A9D4P5S9_DERFA|nr:hypothetical protein HUG17_0041 [Dermatophagoides farinae]